MAIAPTSEITVLKTSNAGAYLITDGIHVAWIMPRQRRDDGTFTAGAYEALANGKTMAEHESAEAAYQKAKAEREAAREKAFQDGKLPTTIVVPANRVFNYSEKAWKVRTNGKQMLYGRWCFVYEYLPKSMVSVEFRPTGAALTMPKWFLEKNRWLMRII